MASKYEYHKDKKALMTIQTNTLRAAHTVTDSLMWPLGSVKVHERNASLSRSHP